jgi:hypothetical protein
MMTIRKTPNNNDDVKAMMQPDFGDSQPTQIAVLSKHTTGNDI